MKVAIVDYGRGNLASVANSLHYLGADYLIATKPQDLETAGAVILPGVGAFDDAANSLRASGLAPALICLAQDGRLPFLGICLGLQLLFEGSDEGRQPGLGLLPGRVRRFPENLSSADGSRLKVPHMGWNTIKVNPLNPDDILQDQSQVYFVHSYYADPVDSAVISASCDYGQPFCAAIRRGNLHAVQFHPEKSGVTGLAILQAFLRDAGIQESEGL
ncbi:imidazole glycerol phosphate synthase subunit HisH [Oscillospiraceae bacterium HV4-5-C5C]|nr:imidazole glycerol phosphate synthase subunit HisH [Oscillospiraceae bacterium HV4-5-C5C]